MGRPSAIPAATFHLFSEATVVFSSSVTNNTFKLPALFQSYFSTGALEVTICFSLFVILHFTLNTIMVQGVGENPHFPIYTNLSLLANPHLPVQCPSSSDVEKQDTLNRKAPSACRIRPSLLAPIWLGSKTSSPKFAALNAIIHSDAPSGYVCQVLVLEYSAEHESDGYIKVMYGVVAMVLAMGMVLGFAVVLWQT